MGPARANRGLAYARLRQYAKALADDTAAIGLNPAIASRWSARCWVRLKLAARDGLPDSALLAAARGDCDRSLALDPSNLDAHNGQGVIKLMNRDPRGAIVDFEAALGTDKANGVALFGRGVAKQLIGDTAGASADMSLARTAAPRAPGDFWDAKLIPAP